MANLHRTLRAKDQAKAEAHAKRAGYKAGGAVTPTKAVHEHEGHLHKGEPKTRIARKRGGSVGGAAPPMRLDRKPRGTDPTAVKPYGTTNRTDVEKPSIAPSKAESLAPPKRAAGGTITRADTGLQGHNGMGKLANLGRYAHGAVKRAAGGRVKKPTVNVIVNTAPPAKPEGADPAKALMGALAAAKPPMPPPLPPGGPVPPMGGPGAPGLPPGIGAPPMMRNTGGRIPMAKMGPKTQPVAEKITVREYKRRARGGKAC